MKKIVALVVVSFSLAACSSVMEPGAEESNPAGVNSVHGYVISSTRDTVTIMTPQGRTYLFNTAGAEKSLKHGVQDGKRVLITYKGEIIGLNTKDTHVLSVSDFKVW